jgi:hypothetical protein
LPVAVLRVNLSERAAAKFVDVYFAPNPDLPITPDLGLLGRILQTPCSLEPFRNPPTRTEVRTCILKLIWLQEEERRKAKQQKRKLPEDRLPHLWILATALSKPIIKDFRAQQDPQWPTGIYQLATAFKTSLVAINQLPLTPDTLWLRILGKGPTQEQAIQEVLTLPSSHPRRNGILRLLASWRVRIELGELQDFPKQEIIMALPQAFLEWEQQTQAVAEERGRQAAQRSLLLLLLGQKFNPLPELVQDVVGLLKSPALEALALECLKVETIAALELWLTQRLRSQVRETWADRFGEVPAEGLAQVQGATLGQLVAVAKQGETIGSIEQGLAMLLAGDGSDLAG